MTAGDAAVTPTAYFDALLILARAPRSVTPLSSAEVHLFAYLSCGLSVLRGHPFADWGYGFSLTSSGRPFSLDLDVAERVLLGRGMASRDERGLLHTTARARAELDGLASLPSLEERSAWGRTAIECALALPPSTIRSAMLARPGTAEAADLGQTRALMTEDDITRIHRERREVETLVGDTADLLGPAVAWLALSLADQEARC